eukprot:1225818-Prymnesium_polylepis.3
MSSPFAMLAAASLHAGSMRLTASRMPVSGVHASATMTPRIVLLKTGNQPSTVIKDGSAFTPQSNTTPTRRSCSHGYAFCRVIHLSTRIANESRLRAA